MIKLVFVIRRRAELAPVEFHRYWLEEHGPLARRLLESLGARRYVQAHTIGSDLNAALSATRGSAEAYDGLAEVWWDSLDELVAISSTEQGRHAAALLIEDEAKFIDLERSSLFVTEEQTIIAA